MLLGLESVLVVRLPCGALAAVFGDSHLLIQSSL